MANSKKADQLDDYRNLSDDALSDHIAEAALRLKKMKFSHSVNPIENPMAIRSARRLVARLKTEEHKRELAS